jgi:hypothetical protein
VASDAASPQAFQQSVSKGATGVAFHEITTVDPVARVADDAVRAAAEWRSDLRNYGIGLYRRGGEAWIPMQVPSHALQLRDARTSQTCCRRSSQTTAQDEPLKSLLLDFAMERIRVDLNESGLLQNEKSASRPFDCDGSIVRATARTLLSAPMRRQCATQRSSSQRD